MKKMATLLCGVIVVLSISFAFIPSTSYAAGSCSEGASNDDPCIDDNGRRVGGSIDAFNDFVQRCVKHEEDKMFGSGNVTRSTCSNALVSCLEATTERSRCFSPSVLADGAYNNNGNHAYEPSSKDWKSIQARNGMPGNDNQKAREARWNALQTTLNEKCNEGASNQRQECRDNFEEQYNECYDSLGGTSKAVSSNDLSDCLSKASAIDKSKILSAWGENTNGGGAGGNPNPGSNADENNSCRVEGVGWLICPVTKFLANIADKAYDLVLEKLLVVEKLNVDTSGGNNGLYKAWEVMRNVANVAFVIAFLIIIYSQITGVGIGNYGIKRMLPRLIVAAILVNISYWICAAAVDISNILGATLKDAATGIGGEATKTITFDINEGGFMAKGNGWSALAVGLLAAGTVIYLGLSVLLPALIVVIMSILTVILVLTLRQALIIVLIVISPLAFVAYLLPNTESLFKKWLNLFKTMLLMYPIISLIFGGSKLASELIMANAAGSILISMMGAVTAVVPLLITPVVMRTAGGLLNRFGGVINNPNKGPFDRMRKKAEKVRERSELLRARNALTGRQPVAGAGRFKRTARREQREKAMKTGLEAAQAGFAVSDSTSSRYAQQSAINQTAVNAAGMAQNAKLRDNIATGGGAAVNQSLGSQASGDNDIQKAVSAQIAKATAEAIKDVQLSANFDPGDIKSIATAFEKAVASNDSVSARAYQNMLLTSGGKGLTEYRKSMNNLTSPSATDSAGNSLFNSSTMSDLRQNMIENNSGVKASAKDLMDQAISGESMSAVSNKASTWSMSDSELVAQKPDSLRLALGAGAINKEQAARIMSNPELHKNLDNTRPASGGQSVREAINTIATTP